MPQVAVGRIERSCGASGVSGTDWIRAAPGADGLERIEAYFSGHAYDPHRHDTYAVGYTVSGVQCFDYRGARADSVAGNAMVVHPDEVHNGRAGVEQGFVYRMLYVAPGAVRDALGDRAVALPFVRSAVSSEARVVDAVRRAFADFHRPLESLEIDLVVMSIAEVLLSLDRSASQSRPPSAACVVATDRARAVLDESFRRGVQSSELEAVADIDRYTLARQFRFRFGTSPYRYLTMRRLEQARVAIRAGTALAEVAADAGFADQSHMTRQFKRAYGISPGRWRRMLTLGSGGATRDATADRGNRSV
ncbi:AraC family transcriptional regulator [Microbaculum marinum]|uniref:AraC family transcriptional regulator n=1 Tax=Microbaculum marinum TaxID=1764581 RepID=A0AAW9RRW3_9HYPH